MFWLYKSQQTYTITLNKWPCPLPPFQIAKLLRYRNLYKAVHESSPYHGLQGTSVIKQLLSISVITSTVATWLKSFYTVFGSILVCGYSNLWTWSFWPQTMTYPNLCIPGLVVLLLWPSWPFSLFPQEYSAPDSRIISECESPHRTCLIFSPFRAGMTAGISIWKSQRFNNVEKKNAKE